MVFEPVVASALVATAVASFYLLSGLVPAAFALLVGQTLLVAVPAIAAVVLHANHRVLGVRVPGARYILAAVLIGVSAWYVNMRLVMWIEPPREELQKLEHLVDTAPLFEALVMLAVIPPVCEEILFRGVLARSLASRLPLWAAVGISAVLFSGYHLSLVQAPATLTLGLAFGLLAVRADSIVPTVIAHALNNAIAVLVSRDEVPGLAGWLGRNPTPAIAVCATASAVGVAIVALEVRA